MLLHDQMIETYLSKSALAIDLQDIKVKKAFASFKHAKVVHLQLLDTLPGTNTSSTILTTS